MKRSKPRKIATLKPAPELPKGRQPVILESLQCRSDKIYPDRGEIAAETAPEIERRIAWEQADIAIRKRRADIARLDRSKR
jgi:hypothetical protein